MFRAFKKMMTLSGPSGMIGGLGMVGGLGNLQLEETILASRRSVVLHMAAMNALLDYRSWPVVSE